MTDKLAKRTAPGIKLNYLEKQATNPQGLAIKDAEKEKIINGIAAIIDGIRADFGLKLTADKQFFAARMYQILQRYYFSLTLNEVKQAFEMHAIGELDPYFKKRANGTPDKEHFQALSIEFITKVLNAYKELKRQANQKQTLALPPSKEISDREKQILRDHMYSKLYENFERYRQNKEHSFTWIIPQVYINLLENLGFTVTIEDAEVEKPQLQSPMKIKDAFLTNTDSIRKNRAIARCFDYIIEQNINIREKMIEHYKNA